MMRKRITALTMALVCAGALCLPVQAAKPSGGGDYISGMEDVQESVESGETDTESAVETLMDGFEYVYAGVYNEDEGQEILLAFDTTNYYGVAAITQPEDNMLVWAVLGEWVSYDDGSVSFVSEDQETEFNFTIDEETEEGMTIGLVDEDGAQLFLETADLTDLEDFFTKMVDGDFAETEDSSDDSAEDDGSSDDSAVAELMADFSDVYYGTYNESTGQDILLAFDYTNELAITVIIETASSTMVYACRGSYTSYDDGTLTIEDPDLENTFEFTVNDQTDDEIMIGLEGGELSIPAVDLTVLEQFYEDMLNGAYS